MSRIVTAAKGVPVVEGGTRRSGHALLGAYGALIGLATGTSNTKISQILGTLPYGSMEHALFGVFPNELRTLIAYDRLFPNSTALIDENEIMDGLRLAVIASGRGLGGVRTDSELAGQGLAGTTRRMREFLDDLGYYDAKILVSNRIDEFELMKSSAESAAYQSVLVGTAAQSPPDANVSNIVYKLVETRDLHTGNVRPIAKRFGRQSRHSRSHRRFPDLRRRRARDSRRHRQRRWAARGYDVARARLGRVRHAAFAARLDRRDRGPHARAVGGVAGRRAPDRCARRPLPVLIAEDLKKKTARVLAEKDDRRPRVGLQIASSDPNRQARMADRTRALYRLSDLRVVPATLANLTKSVRTF